MSIWSTLFWFLIALLLAGVETEIEGRDGWAMKLPTWVRARGPAVACCRFFLGKRPLTGYHMFMFPLPVAIAHAPFTAAPWSLAAELQTLALFMLLAITWDFMWFVINPHFGLTGFRKENVWWYADEPWYLRAPRSYWAGLAGSLLFAALAQLANQSTDALFVHLALMLRFALLTAAVALFAPFYRSWRKGMDDRDDRELLRAGKPSLEEEIDARIT